MADLRDPKTQRTLLVLMALGALGYVFFLSGWFPWGYRAHAEEIRQLESRYEGLSREVTQAQQAARRLDLLKEEYELLTRHWERAKSHLPEGKEIVSLLREVTVAGQSAGVEFVEVKPQPPVPRPYVTEHPYEIKVMGGFHQLGTFLGNVSGLDRLVTVTNIEVKSKDEEDLPVSMEAKLLASAYTLGGIDPQQLSEANSVKGAVNQVQQKITGKAGNRPPEPSGE